MKLDTIATRILGSRWTLFRAIVWPPDAFALAFRLLDRSGAYMRLVDGDNSGNVCLSPREGRAWPDVAASVGIQWRESVAQAMRRAGKLSGARTDLTRSLKGMRLPPHVKDAWRKIRAAKDVRLDQVGETDELVIALVQLAAYADEASSGFGLRMHRSDSDPASVLADLALRSNRWQSLCVNADSDVVCVLPKQHTPQRGLTVRSLSHHLAVCAAGEVQISWEPPIDSPLSDTDHVNLLLVPWPFAMGRRQFRPASHPTPGIAPIAAPFRYFSYDPTGHDDTCDNLIDAVQRAFERALEHVDCVDMVVLPELAVGPQELAQLERLAFERGALLITGALLPDEPRDPKNVAVIQNRSYSVRGAEPEVKLRIAAASGNESVALAQGGLQQAKHHRWCLDAPQIRQYGLSGILSPLIDWWERSQIGTRQIHFTTMARWLTICALVCEDLARQDPLSEVVRSVGPNLVIALLMDGPQLSGRWSSRYASVLAEDPGSSVLTLTSLGMSILSSPAHGFRAPDRSRVVALWRDVKRGTVELELGPDEEAMVLTLSRSSIEEFTLDGRGDGSVAHFPIYAGHHCLDLQRPKKSVP